VQAKALFICHAGNGVGLGHLSRCLVAARALVSNFDLLVDFFIIGDAIDQGFYNNYQVNVHQTTQPIKVLLEQISEKNAYSLLCLDLFKQAFYENIDSVLKEISEKGTKIIAFDDFPCGSKFIDLLYVPSFSKPKVMNDFPDLKVVSGWDCYLLNIQKNPISRLEEKNILILTGGSDPTGLGDTWPSALSNELKKEITINWVTGPYSKRPIFPSDSHVKYKEYIAPSGLTNLMVNATVASTVYGVSFFELIALGIPTVVFSPYGNKDNAELSEIRKLGIAIVVDDEFQACERLVELINNSSERDSLKQKCKRIMKDYSGKRFSDEFKKLICEN